MRTQSSRRAIYCRPQFGLQHKFPLWQHEQMHKAVWSTFQLLFHGRRLLFLSTRLTSGSVGGSEENARRIHCSKQIEQVLLLVYLSPLVPENKSKYKTNSHCHEHSHGIISWVLPVRPFLFQEACLALSKEILRVLCWKVKFLRSCYWSA